MGLDVARVRRIGLDLLAKRGHEHAKRRAIGREHGAPHLFEQVVVREYLAGIARQQTEELVFERREVNLL